MLQYHNYKTHIVHVHHMPHMYNLHIMPTHSATLLRRELPNLSLRPKLYILHILPYVMHLYDLPTTLLRRELPNLPLWSKLHIMPNNHLVPNLLIPYLPTTNHNPMLQLHRTARHILVHIHRHSTHMLQFLLYRQFFLQRLRPPRPLRRGLRAFRPK